MLTKKRKIFKARGNLEITTIYLTSEWEMSKSHFQELRHFLRTAIIEIFYRTMKLKVASTYNWWLDLVCWFNGFLVLSLHTACDCFEGTFRCLSLMLMYFAWTLNDSSLNVTAIHIRRKCQEKNWCRAVWCCDRSVRPGVLQHKVSEIILPWGKSCLIACRFWEIPLTLTGSPTP